MRLITRLNIGGPARQALLLTKEMRPQYETLLVAGRPQRGEGELSHPEVAVERISMVRPLRPHRDVRGLAQVRGLLGRSGARLLHTHMAKAGAIGRIAATTLCRQVVTVHTFHGHVLEGYFSKRVERAFLGIERRLARRTDALIAVSEEVKESLLDLGVGRPSQWHVIPLGFDLSRFLAGTDRSGKLRRALGLRDDVLLVGALGRLAPIKDYATMIRAVSQLPDVHLAILGDGEMRPKLENLIARLGVSGRVHLPGWWRDVPAALSDMDVVALTSLIEGSPVALIEALACARPVVATDVGGVRSVVEHGAVGFLTSPGEVRETADALKALLGDEGLRARMGTEGRRRVRDKYDQRRLVHDIRDLYEELLRVRSSTP